MNDKFPRSPDVIERETLEGGFAKGWSPHAKPTPEYYFDCHIHYKGTSDGSVSEEIRGDVKAADALGIKKAILMLQLYGKKWNPGMKTQTVMDAFEYFSVAELERQMPGLLETGVCVPSVYINYFSPEPELVDAAADFGVKMIKLHNAPVIEDNAPHDLWLEKEWDAFFYAIEKRGLAVLFHVTQRLAAAAYTGGGRNTYWKKGWENGVTYTNEDLLQAFLELCRRYPGIDFVGAHQLHVGWERLENLFSEFKNLYVDTSVGCQLVEDDDFYPNDKDFLRNIFIKNSSRILFGTDVFWGSDGSHGFDNATVVRNHKRFIRKLDLPQETLDEVCFKNSERVFKA